MKVTVVLTCFNRKEKTFECIRGLVCGNPQITFDFVIVDDGSTDGTKELLEKSEYAEMLHVITTNGNLYYSGGMRVGMEHIIQRAQKPDYLLMVNDDVKFYESAIQNLTAQSRAGGSAVIVGTTCDDSGVQSYGGVLYTDRKSVKYRAVKAGETVECDTFNANCVLIPYSYFEKAGVMDAAYIHSLGDFDYGFALKRADAKILASETFVGVCNKNSIKGTWLDTSLPLKKRLALKKSPKGAPAKQWFYFLKKNFGMGKAIVFTITPYVKLFLGR